MVVVATVTYPNEPDATFDMKYYLSTHMPLVMDTWKSSGLQKYEVVQFQKGPDGSDPAFSVQCTLTFGSSDQIEKALGLPDTKKVFDDVNNFSNKGPKFSVGEVTGTS